MDGGGGSASDEQLLPLARMSKLKGGRAAIEADQIPGLAWKAGSPRSAWSDSTKKLRAKLEEALWLRYEYGVGVSIPR